MKLSEITGDAKLVWNKKWLKFKKKQLRKNPDADITAMLKEFCALNNLSLE